MYSIRRSVLDDLDAGIKGGSPSCDSQWSERKNPHHHVQLHGPTDFRHGQVRHKGQKRMNQHDSAVSRGVLCSLQRRTRTDAVQISVVGILWRFNASGSEHRRSRLIWQRYIPIVFYRVVHRRASSVWTFKLASGLTSSCHDIDVRIRLSMRSVLIRQHF